MDDDDDMVLVIVGDEDQAFALPIKEEPVDIQDTELNVESIIQTAGTHGQFIAINAKVDEEYTDCEYLEENIYDKKMNGKKDLPKKQMPKCKKKIIVKEEDEDPDFDSNNVPVTSNRCYKSYSTQPPYIAQLRKNFPKMRKDENYLISSLAEAMRNIKPPPPPPNFYHDVLGKFVCVYCEAANETLPAASRHYQSRHGNRYLTCFACGRDYRCTTMLYKHEKRCNAPDAHLMLKARGRYLGRKGRSRPYRTQDKFDPFNLKNSDKRKYCSQCPATFLHADALQAHENTHSGYRPFQCDQCPAAYTSGIALKKHLRCHTDDVVICDTCGRSFKEKTTLIMHMNTHLPQRKYPCDRCDRRFAQKTTLRTHINRDHLNLPLPFVCAACSKRYPRMSNLKAHMKAQHGLTVMTRRGFFKALPNLSENVLKDATLVFNNNPTLSDLKQEGKQTNELRNVDLSKCQESDSDTDLADNEFDTNAITKSVMGVIKLEEEDFFDQGDQYIPMQDISDIKVESLESDDVDNIEPTDAETSIQVSVLEKLSNVEMDTTTTVEKLDGDLVFITEQGEAKYITEGAFIEAHTISSMIVEGITGAIAEQNIPAGKNTEGSRTDNRKCTKPAKYKHNTQNEYKILTRASKKNPNGTNSVFTLSKQFA